MVINLALGKYTETSSVLYGSTGDKAVDGKREPNVWTTDPTTHTCSSVDKDAWWQVYLEAIYVIREVVIYNQNRCELECFAELTELGIPSLASHLYSYYMV